MSVAAEVNSRALERKHFGCFVLICYLQFARVLGTLNILVYVKANFENWQKWICENPHGNGSKPVERGRHARSLDHRGIFAATS